MKIFIFHTQAGVTKQWCIHYEWESVDQTNRQIPVCLNSNKSTRNVTPSELFVTERVHDGTRLGLKPQKTIYVVVKTAQQKLHIQVTHISYTETYTVHY